MVCVCEETYSTISIKQGGLLKEDKKRKIEAERVGERGQMLREFIFFGEQQHQWLMNHFPIKHTLSLSLSLSVKEQYNAKTIDKSIFPFSSFSPLLLVIFPPSTHFPLRALNYLSWLRNFPDTH